MLQATFRQQALIVALCVVAHLGIVGWLLAANFSSAPPAVPPRPLMVRLIPTVVPTPLATASSGGADGQASAAAAAPAAPPPVAALPTPVAVAPPAPKVAPKPPKLPKPPPKVAATPQAPPRTVRKETAPPPIPPKPAQAVAQRVERSSATHSGNVGSKTSGLGRAEAATGSGAMNAGGAGIGTGAGSAGSGAGVQGSAVGQAAGDGPAVPTHQPKPAYPAFARRLGHEGKVLVRIHVLSSGEVADASVATSSGFSALDEAALAAVKRWRFRPAQRAGRAVDATLNVPITFKLETG